MAQYTLNNGLSLDILLSLAAFSASNSPSCLPFRTTCLRGFDGLRAFCVIRLGAVPRGARGFFGAAAV